MRLCAVTTLRAPLSETIDFIIYHLNIGYDHLFLFFDDPNDAVINEVCNNARLTCISCDSLHWNNVGCKKNSKIEVRQQKNADLALLWAREQGFDWISHIDSDELIYSVKPIKTVLSSLSKSVTHLWLPTREAVPDKLEYSKPYQEISLFRVLPSREFNHFMGKNIDAFYNGEFLRGHEGKSIVRVTDDVKSLVLHFPIFYNDAKSKLAVDCKVGLLHFDCYNFSAWYTKWERRLNGMASAGGRKNRIEQFESFQQLYATKDIDRLKKMYKKMYFLDEKLIELLKKEGMLQNIVLDRVLFS